MTRRKNPIYRRLYELVGLGFMRVSVFLIFVLFAAVVFVLAYKSVYLLRGHSPIELLFSSVWNPYKGDFGFWPIILGTFYVTGISMLIAVPISVLSSIYIAEYLPSRLRNFIKSYIDVLAGIPSVVFGMCAILVLVPLVREDIAPLFGINSTGFCVFTAGVILAVMVFPIIISICVDVFQAVPVEAREVSLAIGATKWQTTKLAVFRAAFPGVASAILLGFGRAFGETMAVAMVVGNLPHIPANIFDAGATLPSIIASTYGETMSIPMYDSALMFLALVLIIIVLLFNLLAKAVKDSFTRMQGSR